MILGRLLEPLDKFKVHGSENVKVSSVVSSSQDVIKECMFVAIRGLTVDGYDFIDEAIKKGASVVVCSKPPRKKWLKKITYIQVKDARKALSILASGWYKNPSEKLKLIGVTGTDGKTTTASMIHHLLETAGKNTGLITTVSVRVGKKQYPSGLHVTNPEPLILQKILAEMVDAGCEYAVLEVTSHGIDQKRIHGMNFDIAVLTNITPEHLDYHKTFGAYKKTKLYFVDSAVKSFNTPAKMHPATKHIKQDYNQKNMSLAILVAKDLGVSEKSIKKAVKTFPGVIGRLEQVKNKKEKKIYIDFAHTPNSLENILVHLKKACKGRLICVFGCAGNRDGKKRKIMGRISAKYANVSVFTAEDPRTESVIDIINEMSKGALELGVAECKDNIFSKKCFYRIPERGEAIYCAINEMQKDNDIVVICGKGHEKSMNYDGIEYPWSDYDAVKLALNGKVKRVRNKVHFMGIGGSGMSGAALLAKNNGYEVTGCDLEKKTAYIHQLKKGGIKIYKGHSKVHLKDQDILVASPAVLFQNKQHPEYKEALEKMTWQQYLGDKIMDGKNVIAVAGTHGKSTTTAMSSLVFEKAGLDPSVMIGAVVNKWKTSFRIGKSDIFIVEADEFYDNFLHYDPSVIILNNIEMDHPDYFKSEEHVYESFCRFLKKLTGDKILIFNQDSLGVQKVFNKLGKQYLKSCDLYGYTLSDDPFVETLNSTKVIIISREKGSTRFTIENKAFDVDSEYILNIPGDYNVSNALGVMILCKIFSIDERIVKNGLASFGGIGRRMELLGEKKGVAVYDDYAHHPTAVGETLRAFRQKYPKKRIWGIIEPHSYSRTEVLLEDYKRSFDAAYGIIVGPIYKARDKQKFGMSEKKIIDVSGHRNAFAAKTYKQLVKLVGENVKKGDVIVVMGAGKSYQWARDILDNI